MSICPFIAGNFMKGHSFKKYGKITIYLLLIILNIGVPFLSGVFFVFLFNEAPEFSIIGIIIGLMSIQMCIAIIYFTYKFWKKVTIGFFVFIFSLFLSPFLKEIEIISNVLFKLFPDDTVSNKLLRSLSVTSFIAFFLWTIILFFHKQQETKHSLFN